MMTWEKYRHPNFGSLSLNIDSAQYSSGIFKIYPLFLTTSNCNSKFKSYSNLSWETSLPNLNES